MLPLVDYHVHTARCGHAVGRMERYVERAIEAGLAELGFSDHLFMYWLPSDRRDPQLCMAEWEHDFYIEDVERCRARYKSDIAIRLSTEADYIPGHERELEAILRRYDWDYVIGSVHFLGDWGFDDSRYLAGFEQRPIDEIYAQYFDLVGASAESGLFDTIGHADNETIGQMYIDLAVSRLRQKFNASGPAPHLIKTVRGEGYLFDVQIEP